MIRKKERMRDLLALPDRGVGKTSGIRGVLAKLFRTMLNDFNITQITYNRLLNDYVFVEAKHENNRRDRTSIRGNLNKEFSRPTMTWKVFNKAMMLLQVRRFRITIDVERENGTITSHQAFVDFRTHQDPLPSEGLDLPDDDDGDE